jgi:hypothetical protein
MRAAIALFVGSHTINTIRQPDGSWDIEVEGEGGIVDLEQGLASFLATAEGNVLLDKPYVVN